ncbi:MAG: hypothetical protein ACLQPD_01295 [Desulfomonilaceae bacterium]
MTPGFDKPLYVLPFNHRGSFETNMFGWEGALTPELIREERARVRPPKWQDRRMIPD